MALAFSVGCVEGSSRVAESLRVLEAELVYLQQHREKETAIVYWGFIGIMEKRMETIALVYLYI